MNRNALHDMPGKLRYRDDKALDSDIRAVIALLFPDYDHSLYERAFADVVRLHKGDYPGYRASNTAYHDLGHTLTVTLACARLMHGIHMERAAFTRTHLTIGLLAALFHDVGYIQAADDTEGTGAKYTEVHVDRSVEFVRSYLSGLGLSQRFIRDVENAIRCTDLAQPLDRLAFSSPETRLIGCALGSADILAQMADETYVEKLPKLYLEFEEAGTTEYASEYDLIQDTFSFHSAMQERLTGALDNVAATARGHFLAHWGVDKDLYALSIEKNLRYLDTVLAEHGPGYNTMLRRSPDRVPTFV